MPTPRPSLRTFGALGVVLGVAAACSGGGGGPSVPSVSTPTILTTSPFDGAVDVEPTAPVLLDIALPEGGSPFGDVRVYDGVNELDGALVPLGGIRWRWQPVGQLPRGNTLEIRSRSQGRVASFTVREANAQRTYELPGIAGSALYTWPNGRAAVHADGRWFEITDAGLVERFVQMPFLIVPYGDGEAVWFEFDPVSQDYDYVRGGLDGVRDRTRPPLVGSGVVANARGDLVTLVPGTFPDPSARGLWRLAHDGVAWELVGPMEFFYTGSVYRVPHVADDGAVSIVADLPEPALWRFAPGSLVPEVTPLPSGLHYTHVTQDKNGAGWALWFEATAGAPLSAGPSRLYRARFEPGEGLGRAEAIYTWPDRLAYPLLSFEPDRLAAMSGRGGSVLLRLQTQGVGLYSSRQEAMRIETDGTVIEPRPYATGVNSNQFFYSANRAEFWVRPNPALSPYATVGAAWRSRPGSVGETIADPGLPLEPLWVPIQVGVVDDSGRIFSIYQALQPGSAVLATHVIVIE